MFNKYILVETKKDKEDKGLINPLKDTFKVGVVKAYDTTSDLKLKKGQEVLFEGGRDVIIDKENYTLIREDQLICQK